MYLAKIQTSWLGLCEQNGAYSSCVPHDKRWYPKKEKVNPSFGINICCWDNFILVVIQQQKKEGIALDLFLFEI